jgi:lysophospholipase L1-like esterase
MPFPEAPGGAYHVSTNALGLRDERALVPKAPGTLRVLVLGDSMTMGVGVEREEAFPAQLEPLLAKRLAPRAVEVVNGGVTCWGQCEETAFLRTRARALEPDLVLLEFTVANDVLDDLRYREVGGRLVPDASDADELASHPLFTNPLASVSRAYRLFVWSYGRHVLRYHAMAEPQRLARASQLVRTARDLAGALGARFALTVAPPDFQLAGGLEEKLARSAEIDVAIVGQAQRDGIPALDLGAALREARRSGETVHFPVDHHWNPAGHRVVARAIAEWLPLQ